MPTPPTAHRRSSIPRRRPGSMTILRRSATPVFSCGRRYPRSDCGAPRRSTRRRRARRRCCESPFPWGREICRRHLLPGAADDDPRWRVDARCGAPIRRSGRSESCGDIGGDEPVRTRPDARSQPAASPSTHDESRAGGRLSGTALVVAQGFGRPALRAQVSARSAAGVVQPPQQRVQEPRGARHEVVAVVVRRIQGGDDDPPGRADGVLVQDRPDVGGEPVSSGSSETTSGTTSASVCSSPW